MPLADFKELDDEVKYWSNALKSLTDLKGYFYWLFAVGDDAFNIIDFINIIEYIKHLKDGPTKSRKK